jgi:H+/gluconate symporter-like permease
MATLKQDRTLMKRHFRDMLYLGVPFLLLLLGMVLGSYWFRSPVCFIVGFVIAVPLAIVGLVRQERRWRRFPSPGCGTMLHREVAGKPGDPITFVCKPCDTEWDTGFRTGSD